MHEAVRELDAGILGDVTTAAGAGSLAQPRTDGDDAYNPEWRKQAAHHVIWTQAQLLPDDEVGVGRGWQVEVRRYLLSRGIQPQTWYAFGLGAFNLHGLPAVAWPVVDHDTGDVWAVRYRFTEARPDGTRYLSRKGSRQPAHLFGVPALWADSTARLRCLCLFEGEFNAMSAWQVGSELGIDVLSFGSESQRRLPTWALVTAARYGVVMTWLDDAEKSQEVGVQLSSVGIRPIILRSTTDAGVKLDANELLQRDMLRAVLVGALVRGVQDVDMRSSLLWRLWDVRHGLDAATARQAARLAKELGHDNAFSGETEGN